MTIVETPANVAVEERRSSGQIAEVRHPERIIRIVAMPYDVPTNRAAQGWVESFGRSAFAGIEHRNGRIRVNREHVLGQPVGRVTTWYPDDPKALVADLSVSRTALGDETLELASDGVLDASIGFLPMPGGEVWTENRTRRHITKAWLHHLALTADPAYDGANVLEVRTSADGNVNVVASSSATPLKDQILAMLIERGHMTGIESRPT